MKDAAALTRDEAEAELARLSQLLASANRAYHGEDAPEISDAAYDRLRLRLEAIEQALRDAEGNITRAAELLGMKRPSAISS